MDNPGADNGLVAFIELQVQLFLVPVGEGAIGVCRIGEAGWV